MSVRIPHLALPIAIRNGAPLVLEQDSPEEIAQCVRNVLAYRPGERIDAPEFGYSDPTFAAGGVDLDELREVIERWEPRALALVERDGGLDADALAELAPRVRVQIGPGGDA